MVIKQSVRLIATLIGILFVGCLPALFRGLNLSFSNYFGQMGDVLVQVLHPGQIGFQYEGRMYPLFPEILNPYFYSMKIFFAALIFSFLLALAGTYITFFLPQWLRKTVLFLAFIGESLPDIFIMVVFQMIVILIYQKTGMLLLNISEGFDQQIFFLPVLCLSILPACFFYRMMMVTVGEQMDMDYITVAKSKGLGGCQLLFKHILRNIAVPVLSYSKTVVWMLLSNLVILEFVFGMHGLMTFIYNNPTPLVFTISLFLIFVPFYILYTFFSVLIRKLTGRGAVI